MRTGALDAGCNFFAGYPISPATPLLLHMIRELPKTGGIAIQAEDEIAAHQHVHRRGHDGHARSDRDLRPGHQPVQREHRASDHGRSATRHRGRAAARPGHRRRDDARPGRRAVRPLGHVGRLPDIALAPGSVTECYALTRAAFSLAERFRVPVFLLTDKEMFQSLSTVEMDGYEQALPRGAAVEGGSRSFSPIGGEQITRFTGSTTTSAGS